MKTSRFLIHGFSKCSGLIVLFTLGIVWGSDMTTGKPTTPKHLSVIVTPTSATAEKQKDGNITPSPEKHSEASLASPTGSKPLAESASGRPKSKDTAPAPKLPPKQTHAVATPLASHHQKKANSTTVSSLSDQQGTAGDISNTSTSKKTKQIEKKTEMTTLSPQDITDCYPVKMDIVDSSSLGMPYIIIIIIVVFCVLLIAVCLCCWFKH